VRRGFIYGSMLPEGVMEDDGVDRGIVFLWMGAYLARQFEFAKSQWHRSPVARAPAFARKLP
jgi:hypothetical protein